MYKYNTFKYCFDVNLMFSEFLQSMKVIGLTSMKEHGL